ncbi:MAG: BlaI/MecI/CopY family transcriptional regulator [Pseudomonadota bacterium]
MSTNSKILNSWFPGTRKRSRTPALGERELAVLDILWRGSPRTAQQVQESMPGAIVSLSTIQSTLERLHRKNVLSREKQARAFQYAPLMQRNELISRLLYDIADDVAGGDVASMVSGFMAFLGDERDQLTAVLENQTQEDADQTSGEGAVSVAEDRHGEHSKC